MRKLVLAAVPVLFAPLGCMASLAAFGGAGGTTTAALTAAAAACAYAYPDPERVAATIADLTAEPVTATHWDRYSAQAGIVTTTSTPLLDDDGQPVVDDNGEPVLNAVQTPIAYSASTAEQRRQVLDTAVRQILWSNPPATVTTPAVVWWHGDLPADDNDTGWSDTPVPGWDGRLGDYLDAFLQHYVDVDIDHEHTCTPPYVASCPQPASIPAALATIRHLESANDYGEHRRAHASGGPTGSGWPSGAYQYLRASWDGYRGYDEAWQAPPDIQDARATIDVDAILATYHGDPSWIPVSWYAGPAGAAQIAAGTRDPNAVPNPDHNTISVAEYQAKWMEHYTTIALSLHGAEAAVCDTGGSAAVAWGETQLGAPYAAASPWRFGNPWPGGTRTGDRGTRYTFPAGTIVYDCSGFVIAAWRHAGIDLTSQYGVYGSQDLLRTPLQDVPPAAAQPGDLAVYSPLNGVGHVVMIHHTDPDGTVHTIEASPSTGVAIKTINWPRVTAIKRPAAP